jgi:hypothetical protein
MPSSLSVVEDLGSKYWNGEYRAQSDEIRAAEEQIKAELHNLSRDSYDLFRNQNVARKLCDDEVKSLRMVVTGGDFGDGLCLVDQSVVFKVRTAAGDARRMSRNQRDTLKRRFI